MKGKEEDKIKDLEGVSIGKRYTTRYPDNQDYADKQAFEVLVNDFKDVVKIINRQLINLEDEVREIKKRLDLNDKIQK